MLLCSRSASGLWSDKFRVLRELPAGARLCKHQAYHLALLSAKRIRHIAFASHKSVHASEWGSGRMHLLLHASFICRSHLLSLAFSWQIVGADPCLGLSGSACVLTVTEGVHFLGVVHCFAQAGLLSLAFPRTPLFRSAQASACF